MLNVTEEEGGADNASVSDVASVTSYVSTWILIIYFTNVAVATFLNGISFLAILRSKRNGTLSIILQLSATDVLSTYVCIMEIWSIKKNTWPFTHELCPFFSGAEVLINSLTLYLIIVLNFHTISLCNLKTSEIDLSTRNPLTSCDASNECLVRDSRSITIDYRQKKTDVSIIFPCILVWILCVSLSIPQFTLSSTLKNSTSNVTICTVADLYYGRLLQNLLVVFRVFIPGTLILISITVLLYKLYQSTKNGTIQNIFAKKSHNILYYLMFCIVLNLAYLLTSLQRMILHWLFIMNRTENSFESYKMPPLYNKTDNYLNLMFPMLHYSGTFCRFLIYLFLLPKFKSLICNKILMCLKSRN